MADFTVSSVIDGFMQAADAPSARTAIGLGSLSTLSAAPAGTLTGTALNSTVVTSSLTSVGTLTSLALSGAITDTQSIGVTSTNGLLLQNITAAALGAQQWSPRIKLTGQGWGTGASANKQVDFMIENQTVQGALPTGLLAITSLVQSGSPITPLTLSDQGALTIAAGFSGTSGTFSSGLTATTGAFSGTVSNTKTGAASTAAATFNGTPFAGTGTTSFPLVYLNESGATASTTLSTSGTYFGINAHTSIGNTNLCDWMFDGVSKFKVTSSGVLNASASVSTQFLNLTSSGNITFASRGALGSTASGALEIYGNTSFTIGPRLGFGGNTSNFPAINPDAVNGFTFQSAAGTATWNDNSTGNIGTVANRYMVGIAAPTLTATGTSVTDTVASTVYIGGAPTASTNTTIGTAWALNVAAGNTNLGGALTVGGGTSISKSATFSLTISASVSAGTLSSQAITATGVVAGDTCSYPELSSVQPTGIVIASVRCGTDIITVDFYNSDLVNPHTLTGTVKVRSFKA